FKYYYNGALFTGASAAGDYDITAKFTIDAAHAPNYEPIPDMTKTLTISDKPPVEGAENIVVPSTITETYTGSPVDYAAQNVPVGVEVSYTIEKDGAEITDKDIINVGVYTVTVKFETAADKAPIADKTCTVTVVKADVDMSGVKFEDLTVAYDGKTHTLTYTGTLPATPAVTVTYVVKDSAELSFTEIGTYEFTATFTHNDTDNYNLIENKTATLTISDASILGITAKVEDGAKFTTVNTLDDLKKVLTVTVNTTGGDSVTEDYELTCEGLRDGGMFKYGLQKITVKYIDESGEEFSTFVEIYVEKQKVALPTFKGGLSYTGVTVKPTAADFNGYDSTLMTFVTDKLQSGLNVGSYKAVFA
ncbi:MAG: MBG domain-containing protein, partial [Clostridia bacterium]|nr:MBG domain-containing protein [Clostridia bacterium]